MFWNPWMLLSWFVSFFSPPQPPPCLSDTLVDDSYLSFFEHSLSIANQKYILQLPRSELSLTLSRSH